MSARRRQIPKNTLQAVLLVEIRPNRWCDVQYEPCYLPSVWHKMAVNDAIKGERAIVGRQADIVERFDTVDIGERVTVERCRYPAAVFGRKRPVKPTGNAVVIVV